jgi:hypothetical protein
MTALVVGSMSPDFPLFVGWPQGYALSHSLVGSATVDVAVALIVLWLWLALFRDSMIDLAPGAIRSRLPRQMTLTRREWLLSVPAAWVGSLTHVVWDSFTHSGRWGVALVPWLRVEHAGLPRYEWAQYVSTLVGLAVVCVMAILYLRGLARSQQVEERSAWVPALLPAALVVGTIWGILGLSDGSWPTSPAATFRYTLNICIAGFWCLVGVCLAWRILLRKLAEQPQAQVRPRP